MSSWLGGIFKDPDKRAILSWLGGGAVVVAGGVWSVVTFYIDHKDGQDKKGGPNITVEQGIGSVGEIHGPVNIGPSKEQIEQIQKPLAAQLATKDSQIATLTQMLLEKNPAVAAPGAQQAVGTAVASITQGAEEGDPRLKQALGLLKENKTAEAAQLLNAVAKDKTAHSELAAAQAKRDRKEAAIAYRNLGAIAALHDPKAARDAYARAVALDPDDADGLFWDGWFQLDAGNTAAAEKSYRALVQLAGKGADENQIFWARNGLADIAMARGDLNAALVAYGEARSVMDRLAKSDPGNAGWQRDLSISYIKVGGVQEAQGDLAGALKSYSDSLAIADRLAKSDPGNAGWQHDLSVSYDNVGGVQEAQGNLAGALKSYSDSLAIRDRLAKSDPGNAGWQRDLSVSYSGLASVYRQLGDSTKALEALRQGHEIISRMTKLSPDNAVWQQDLAWFDGQINELEKER